MQVDNPSGSIILIVNQLEPWQWVSAPASNPPWFKDNPAINQKHYPAKRERSSQKHPHPPSCTSAGRRPVPTARDSSPLTTNVTTEVTSKRKWFMKNQWHQNLLHCFQCPAPRIALCLECCCKWTLPSTIKSELNTKWCSDFLWWCFSLQRKCTAMI